MRRPIGVTLDGGLHSGHFDHDNHDNHDQPPPPTPPPVTAAALAGLMPSLDELKTIMNNPALIAGPNSTGIAAPDPKQQVYEPAGCASSFSAGSPPAFEGTGWRGFYGISQAQSPTPSVVLGESVVTFDDAAAAQKALANYVEQWRRCADTRFTWKIISQGQQSEWTLGQPVDAGGGVTSLRNVNANSPVTVTRAIAAKNNVLVDVQIMGSDLPSRTSRSPNASWSAFQAERGCPIGSASGIGPPSAGVRCRVGGQRL